VNIDARNLRFRSFDFGERGSSGDTFIEFGFVQKNHLEDFIVGLNGRLSLFFLQLLASLSIINVISSILVFGGIFFVRK
jgi:hypothetical protein